MLLPFPRDPDEANQIRDSHFYRACSEVRPAQGEASRWLHLPPLSSSEHSGEELPAKRRTKSMQSGIRSKKARTSGLPPELHACVPTPELSKACTARAGAAPWLRIFAQDTETARECHNGSLQAHTDAGPTTTETTGKYIAISICFLSGLHFGGAGGLSRRASVLE